MTRPLLFSKRDIFSSSACCKNAWFFCLAGIRARLSEKRETSRGILISAAGPPPPFFFHLENSVFSRVKLARHFSWSLSTRLIEPTRPHNAISIDRPVIRKTSRAVYTERLIDQFDRCTSSHGAGVSTLEKAGKWHPGDPHGQLGLTFLRAEERMQIRAGAGIQDIAIKSSYSTH